MAVDATYTVALDVMGADRGPDEIIRGGIDAARNLSGKLKLVLVGHRDKIQAILKLVPEVPASVTVHHAETEVSMHVGATEALKMRDSSISVGVRLVKDRSVDAFVSPGNTGAVMATSLLTLGRIEGVSRPAVLALFPTESGQPCVMLDCGANVDCKPLHLQQFAVMGSVYSSIVFNHESPRVGLMSIGEERSKGNELIFEAHERLKDSKINFVGNIEGRDVLAGTVDVVVTDGFTGNIILKFAESVQPLLMNAVKRQMESNIFSRMGVYLMLPFMKRMKKVFDYAEYGGAPLLGVNGIVIICHGSSNARAVTRATEIAWEMAAKKIKERIHDELITNHFGKTNGSKDSGQDNRNGIIHSAAANDQRGLREDD
jgi:glycerol-3-phosphate acyltransferase PlsX